MRHQTLEGNPTTGMSKLKFCDVSALFLEIVGAIRQVKRLQALILRIMEVHRDYVVGTSACLLRIQSQYFL